MPPEPMIAIFTFVSPLIRSHPAPERAYVGARVRVVPYDRLAPCKLLDLLPGHLAGFDQLRDPEVIVHKRLTGHAADHEILACNRSGDGGDARCLGARDRRVFSR